MPTSVGVLLSWRKPDYSRYSNADRFSRGPVDGRESVAAMMSALRENGQVCTRMGAYKPPTSPYSIPGHGRPCLPYVFELVGKYGIKVVAMEITHESRIDEISEALRMTVIRPV